MEITEVRIFLKDGTDKKLKAYATVTFDNAFVVRNIKIIEGQKGLFVAMPSRKLKESCPKCNFKNALRSKFCNNCGAGLPQTERRPVQAGDIAQKDSEHRDIAHPITLECREYLQKKVLEAYEAYLKGGADRLSPAAGTNTAPSANTVPSANTAPSANTVPSANTAPAPTAPKKEEKKSLEGDLEF